MSAAAGGSVTGGQQEALRTSVREALRLLAGEPRGPWIGVVVLAAVVSVLEAVGAGMVFAVIGLISTPDSEIVLPLVGELRDTGAATGESTVLLRLVVGVAAFFVLRAVVILSQIYLQYRVVHTTGVRLSRGLLAGYLALPLQRHLGQNSSDMIRNVYETVQLLVAQAFVPMVVILTESLVTVALVAVLLAVQPVPALMALLLLGPLLALVFKVIHPRLVRLGRDSQDFSAAMLRSLTESLRGVQEIQVLGSERHFLDRFAGDRTAHAVAQYRRATLLETPRVLVETIVVLFVLGLFGITLTRDGNAQETLAVLGLFGYAALRVMPSLNRVVGSLNSLRAGAAAISDVARNLPAPGAVVPLAEPPATPTGSPPALELRDVTYRYDGSPVDALKGVSASIAPGTFVGLVGPTGGGKSTLLNVLLGLLTPTKGAVLVDGEPLAGGWNGLVGLVPQSVFLLDDSVRANVAFGVAPDDIDDRRVWECLATAQIDEFVRALPAALGTQVGEAGARWSGGQRQRLAIARALYRDPPILVFDEGTSALDHETEQAVIDALERLRGRKTLVAVAHRHSTVVGADEVLVLRDGRVIDRGKLSDLLARHPWMRARGSASTP